MEFELNKFYRHSNDKRLIVRVDGIGDNEMVVAFAELSPLGIRIVSVKQRFVPTNQTGWEKVNIQC